MSKSKDRLKRLKMFKRLKRIRVNINIRVVQMFPVISASDNQKYKNLRPLPLQQENRPNREFKDCADKSIQESSQ